MRRDNLYSAYGLTIASELPLPELPPGAGVPDVTFRTGPVPEDLPDCAGRGVCFQSAPGRALVRPAGPFRMLVRDGTEVVIDRSPEVDDDTLRLFLLGTCLGLLLQQRGAMVLHAATVARQGRAVALAGPSSTGKTTLAAVLMERGCSLVADEATLVAEGADGSPLAVPGAPSLILWRHALVRLSRWSEKLRPARPGVEKYVVPATDRFTAEPTRLTHVFVLARWTRNEIALEHLRGFDRFHAFLDQTFREAYLSGMGLDRNRQVRCGAVAPQVQVYRLSWPHRWTDLAEAADVIEETVFRKRATLTTPSPQDDSVIPGAPYAG